MIAVGQEADLLAVFLLGHAQADLAGQGPDFVLAKTAHRQEHPLEQLPLDAEQHVRLVFAVVDAAKQRRPAIGAGLQPGVVPRGHEVGTHAVGIVEQLAELQPVVADHAGVRRAAGRVLGHEVIDDPVELVLKIQGVKRNPQPVGNAPGVVGVGRGAAALLVAGTLDDGKQRAGRGRPGRCGGCIGGGRSAAFAGRHFAVPHQHTDDLVAGRAQQVRRDTAVDASRHGQDDA